jgi:hypothetical protein
MEVVDKDQKTRIPAFQQWGALREEGVVPGRVFVAGLSYGDYLCGY